MTGKINLMLLASLLMINVAKAQEPAKQQAPIDTTFTDYDALFNELDALLDSLAAPRSFGLFNIGIGSNYFDYESKSSYLLEASKKMTYTPTLSYFFKSGLGISGSAVVVNDGKNINPFQFDVTGSYDYLKNSRFLTGVALTHFFTKDSLPFYTSPLKNELYAYFTYRKSWIRPTVSASYGWGNRSDYYEREDYITSLQLALNGFTKIRTQESVNDFNLMASIRHDFYWLNILSNNDYIRLTPQLVFISGTQKFGFNQTSDSYATLPRTGANVLYNSDKVYLDNQMYFQPLSLSVNLKTEYAKGKFFLQPQLLFDYYFPAIDNKLSTAFVLNAGIIF
jgi:hypothetical protein